MSAPGTSDTPVPMSITEAAAALRAGTLTAVELTRAVLARADAVDPELGCFLARFDATALAAAQQADEELAAGNDRGPLHGIPLGIKDLLSAREGPTTAHSRVPSDAAPPGVDAPAVARLREGGAVIVGKTTLSEYALGAPDPDAGLPLPRNPWHAEHWPGGSSSGTASGLAAGLFLGGLGTDTGGSVRIPAACCGVTGLKPTYGRVPKSRCIALAYSLDTVGPMARTVEDCALLLQPLSGPDPTDPTTVEVAVPSYVDALGSDLDGLRIGVERAHHGTAVGVDPALVRCIDAALDVLAAAGASIEEVTFDHIDAVDAANRVIMQAESFAFHRQNLRTRWHQYGSFTRLLLAQGAFVSGPEYVQAQRVRAMWCDQVRRLHDRVDLIVTPTIGVPAPRLDADFLALMPLFFTGAWNLTGSPVLSMPAGFVDGLPIGIQVVGRPFDEASVLRAGAAFQRRTDWHRRCP